MELNCKESFALSTSLYRGCQGHELCHKQRAKSKEIEAKMAQLLSFPLATKPPKHPSDSLSKAWLPCSHLDVKVTTAIPAKNKRRVVVVCSVGGDGTTKPTVVKEPEAVPASVVLGRSSFPPGFAFGVASSAYQIEGAWNIDGRGPSIWDTFTHEQPHKIKDGSNGDVATDSYHRYEEDIESLKELGVDSYRFSISWSRILPDGTTKKINQKGIDYYNKIIDKLLENGITPFVTLFHWDVPQHLEEAYGGFRSRQIVDHFVEFAKICYKEFGNRVKHWITLNEPWTFSCVGYCLGRHAPGRCTPNLFQYPESCPAGDSSTEPYIVTHNLLLAHAKAARLYKDHFQATQGGNVGITLVSLWFIPLTESPQDKDAVTRSLEFMLGWFVDPLTTGDYPFSMRAIVKERLPCFTNEEKDMIKGSFDFIGINYYSSRYVTPLGYQPPFAILDSFAEQREKNKDGVPIGELHGSWIYVVPDGIKELLLYIKERYNNPKIYITENGTVEKDDPELPMETAIHDEHRIEYMSTHLAQVRQAMREGADVQGYFAWSIKDNFEWNEGYIERFGLNYVDFKDDLKRYPKSSFKFYNKFLHS